MIPKTTVSMIFLLNLYNYMVKVIINVIIVISIYKRLFLDYIVPGK